MSVRQTKLYSPFYDPWLASLLNHSVIENRATCESCVMVGNCAGQETRDPGPFKAHLKCCTHFPFLPNFALGGILKAGKESEKKRALLAMGKGWLSPLGLFPGETYRRTLRDSGENSFGKLDPLLCPLFNESENNCGIWKFRPGVCSSYFCKTEDGKSGFEYWSQVEAFLNLFEWTLAHEVLWSLGLTQKETEEAANLSEAPKWYEFQEAKRETLIRTYEIATQITPQMVLDSMGSEGLELLEQIKKMGHQRVHPVIVSAP